MSRVSLKAGKETRVIICAIVDVRCPWFPFPSGRFVVTGHRLPVPGTYLSVSRLTSPGTRNMPICFSVNVSRLLVTSYGFLFAGYHFSAPPSWLPVTGGWLPVHGSLCSPVTGYRIITRFPVTGYGTGYGHQVRYRIRLPGR